MLASLVASFHYIALALGLGGLFMRGRYLRGLQAKKDLVQNLLAADNAWGVAALLWIVTGLLRAFAGLEKGTQFYLQSPLFWVKMGLFLAVFMLEILPMVTFIRWRIALMKKRKFEVGSYHRLIQINHLQMILVILIPFVASAMARGIWN